MSIAERSLRPLVVATAVACPVFLVGLYTDSQWVRLPAKPWPHLVLLAWMLASGAGVYARRIAVAIALCMVADLLLEFRNTMFVAGIGVFLAAQLTFASAFTMRCRDTSVISALPFALWLGAAFTRLAPGLGSMRIPVMAYMAAIGLMLWRAAACVASGVPDGVDDARTAPPSPTAGRSGTNASRLALAGAVVFGISDTMIAFDRFQAPVPGARYFIILTYWAALALIAASAVRVARASP